MATGDSTAQGWAGQVFSDEESRKRLDHKTIKSDVLDEMIRLERKQLQYLLKLRGEYYNPENEVCREFGIHKKYLAYGLVLQEGEKGRIVSISELARRLNVSRTTIQRHWPEVVRAINSL